MSEEAEVKILNQLKKIVNLFCNIQTTDSKEEAFLKGYLMGLGEALFHLEKAYPNLQLVVENPQIFIEIEKEIRDIHMKIIKERIEQTKELLKEIYEKKDRELPEWLK